MTGSIGATVAAAATVAAIAVTAAATSTAAAVTTAVGASPRRPTSAGAPLTLAAPTVRELGVAAIGNARYDLQWEFTGRVCPQTVSIGASRAVPSAPAAGARLFPGDGIREEGAACTGGGLLAVTVGTLLGPRDAMARLGEADVADRLGGDAFARPILDWAAVVGLRMHTWACAGVDRWPDSVVAFFGDASLTVNDVAVALPAGQRHMILATPTRMTCIYSGRASDASAGGGGLPLGAIIGITFGAILVAAVAATIVVVVVVRRRRVGAAGGQATPDGWGAGGGGAPPQGQPPASCAAPIRPGVEAAAAGHPGGVGAPWAPNAAPPYAVAAPVYPTGAGAWAPQHAPGKQPAAGPAEAGFPPTKPGVEAAAAGHPGWVAAPWEPNATPPYAVAAPAYSTGAGAALPLHAPGGQPAAGPAAAGLAPPPATPVPFHPVGPSVGPWNAAAVGGIGGGSGGGGGGCCGGAWGGGGARRYGR